MKKICCIFNYPPHYRMNIYSLMDKKLDCDFYFGKNVPGNLKEMDCSILKGFKYRFKNHILKNKIIWSSNTLKLLFKKEYNSYILSVDTACISEWIFLIGARLLRKRTYLWCHGWYGDEKKSTKLRKLSFYKLANKLLLYSEYAKKLLIKEGIKQENMVVIANSLNYDEQLILRTKLKKSSIFKDYFNNDSPVILFIGRLEPKKQLGNIIQMVSNLQNKGINTNIVFIGKGSDSEKLKYKVQELNLNASVWFYGSCYDENRIAELIYNADICLSPGNVGLTSIHSLSFGTPVITHSNFAHQMPEFEAIINNKNGAFFEENNMESMTKVVSDWLQKYPIKTKEIVDSCYKIIDQKYNPYYQLEVLKRTIL
ncbi:glycosyltransferase [Bacteroides eggerthii]|jgi:glycosyltransferase involved in cell wall biosynthesis|uniref:Glycosyl transferases group 1 n=2 Tax=Bacteroides eggerthii TaxID=28111 RepID=A0A414M557_9BACE|nr:glycosyltransferase [Bacteroides eggerthii]QUT46533.1 Glycosyl transferases group 1 [Bacteroides eggerthii]RGU02293.1 glycosyltransferase [Bacteroides eggerthii]RHF04681.1 glycosyltransferase [Bacteroides eggerthii]RHH23745.1 glycosyltransferase [Bacteroides eggerthii]